MESRNSRGERDEGSILVTAAVLMIAVAAIAGLALGGGSLYAAAQEGRRAADFGALAGAANLPTLNLGSRENPLGLPKPREIGTPLGTVDTSSRLPTLGEDFLLGTCAVVERQFTDRRSPITESYQVAPTTCSPQVSFSSPWLQAVADCIAGTAAAADCASRFQEQLAGNLPPRVASSRAVTALQDAIAGAGLTGQVVTAELLGRIKTLDATLGGRLAPLIAELEAAGGISLDLTKIAPALLTPNVTVQVTQQVDLPGVALLRDGPVTLRHTSTARRAIKNAVLLPTVGPVRADGTFTFDPNPTVLRARDVTLRALDRIAEDVTPAADAAMQTVVCPAAPFPCPTVSTVFTDLTADVRDAVDPSNGTPPDAATLIRQAIDQREPIMVATTSFVTDPSQVLGSTIYNLPGVRQLLPGLLFVPALEVVPAILSAGPLGQVLVTPVATAEEAARTRGLYRARLVD